MLSLPLTTIDDHVPVPLATIANQYFTYLHKKLNVTANTICHPQVETRQRKS